MKPLRVLVLILAISLMTPLAVSAQECTEIKAIGHPDWQPMSFLDNNQETMIGVSYDLLQDFAQKLSIPVKVVPKTPWKRVLKLLKDGDVDLVTGAFFSEDRAKFAEYSDSYLEFSLVAVVSGDRTFSVKSLDDLVGLEGVATLGDYYGPAFEDFAEANMSIHRGTMPDQSMFEMIVLNRVQFTILSDMNFLLKSSRHGYRDKLEAIPLPMPINTTHYLFSKLSPCAGLVSKYNELIAVARKDGVVAGLVDQYVERITAAKQNLPPCAPPI